MLPQSPARTAPDLRLVTAVVLIAVVILVVRTVFGRAGLPFFADTDDAMRMVMVRDFAAGQNWFDLTAHRLNTPWGAELHWSRLVDLPLAGLLLLFTPIVGADAALVAAGFVWPMLLLATLLWLSARLAFRLVGAEGVLPALVLPILSPAILAEFTPGRVDHHNVIIVLTLAMAWAGVESLRRPWFAALGGLLAATALAIATEALPAIAAASLVAGLAWVADPARRRTMLWFGWSFLGFSLIHLALLRLPSRWLELACDTLSPVYLAVALVVAGAFTLASLMPGLRQWWQRLFMLGLLGGIGMVAVAWAFPQCLAGPYGDLDPWLRDNWIAGIVEARPWTITLRDMPAYAVAVGAPVLLAVLVMLVRLWRVADERQEWAALLVFLLCTALIMLAQVRGARLALMPAIPAAAWLIVAARHRYLAAPRVANIAGLALSWLAFSGIVLSLLVTGLTSLAPGRPAQVAEARASKEPCLVPGAFADLSGLPPERILSPIDLGAHLMLYTPHEVVAAPYHRNEDGVFDAFRFFNRSIEQARTILENRGIGLVVLCPAMAELRGLPGRAEDSFVNLLAADQLPDWLEDVSLPASPLRIFAVSGAKR